MQAVTQFKQLGALGVERLQDLFAHIGRRFGRREMQERALQYVVGLLSPLERKNGWQLAEAAQHARPYSMQHLLDRAHWDADAVRDDLSDYIVETLGERDGVLVVDETGFIKKGASFGGGAAPVQRHRRAHRELPDRGLCGLRQCTWSCADGA